MRASTLRWAAELREEFLLESGAFASHREAEGLRCHDEDGDGRCDICGDDVEVCE